MNKILFLCTPGLGALDNILPLAKDLTVKNKVDILIMKGLYNQFKHNPELKKLTEVTFRKKFILGYFNTIFETKNVDINRFQVFVYSLISLFLNLISVVRRKQLKLFLEKYIFFFYDIYENHKEYFSKFSKILENKKKFSLRHGLGIDHQNYKDKLMIRNTVLLSYSKLQSEFYKKDLNHNSEYKIINIGIPKHRDDWKDHFSNSHFKNNLPLKDYVFLISRHVDSKYLPFKKKENIIKMIKRDILDKNIKIIIKLHPKESKRKNFIMYSNIFGKESFNKNWFISDLHPLTLSKNCLFSVSFFSSVCLDVISNNKINVELLNINTGGGEIPDFSFKKYNLTHFVNNEIEFKSFVENFKIINKELVNQIKKNYYYVYSQDDYDINLIISHNLS
jgi:hypothetical protein